MAWRLFNNVFFDHGNTDGVDGASAQPSAAAEAQIMLGLREEQEREEESMDIEMEIIPSDQLQHNLTRYEGNFQSVTLDALRTSMV